MAKAQASTTSKKTKSNRTKRTVNHGCIHILASFNNTLISISDLQGNVLASTSAGACGFRGAKKGSPHAAQTAANQVITKAMKNFNLKKLNIYVKGVGSGRESTIRTLLSKDIQIDLIADKTSIPHGGVRPRKARRV
ncbi:MAG: 30S ribosomal protein S11 [Candidatus Saccharibacteria bacterium]|nr:30S ribosomal protein S11 [Candidatus Saccharibacteria bacterium]